MSKKMRETSGRRLLLRITVLDMAAATRCTAPVLQNDVFTTPFLLFGTTPGQFCYFGALSGVVSPRTPRTAPIRGVAPLVSTGRFMGNLKGSSGVLSQYLRAVIC